MFLYISVKNILHAYCMKINENNLLYQWPLLKSIKSTSHLKWIQNKNSVIENIIVFHLIVKQCTPF